MRLLSVIVLIALIVSCSSVKNVADKTVENSIQDSTEYEMIVMDPSFETWFISNSKPDWYHSLDYYENWNRQYTHVWNAQISGFPNEHLLSTPINYEDNVDYGLEINHKLFYYFQYVERVLHIPILTVGPGHVVGL